jgi:hypothetical protein
MHVPNYQDRHGCFSLSIFCTLHKVDISYPIFKLLGEGPKKLKELGQILSLCIQVDSKKALSMWVLQAPWEFHPCLVNHFCLTIKHTIPLQHFGCKRNEMSI